MRMAISSVSASIAAAAVYALLHEWLQDQPAWLRWIGVFVVFAVAFGVTWKLSRADEHRSGIFALSRNRSKGNMKMSATNLDVESAGPAKIGSANISGGDMHVTLKDTSVKSR